MPQALAYGQLAGLAPVAGLYCALAAVTAYALLGTSRYLNVGPASSVAVLIAAALTPLAAGAALVLARVRTSVRDLMRRTGLEERIGEKPPPHRRRRR